MANYQGNRPSYGSRPATELPQPEKVVYLEEGRLRSQLVDEEAEKWAKQLKEVAPSQLRRFYEHVVSLKRRLDENSEKVREEAFRGLRPEFKLLKAKAVYMAGRKGELEPLLRFFINHTSSVEDVRQFDAFCKHFEAVVAFHKYYGRKEQ
jgi:CRISPR-associated protein Csm2